MTTSRRHGQWALAAALIDDDPEWMNDIGEADLPPVDLTDPPRRFELLWDELFGDVAPRGVLPDFETVEIDAELTAYNTMRVKARDVAGDPERPVPVAVAKGA